MATVLLSCLGNLPFDYTDIVFHKILYFYLLFRPIIHFQSLFLCEYPKCSGTICRKASPFPVELSWYLCCKSLDRIRVDLFMDSLFCSTDIKVYSYTNTSWVSNTS